MQRTIRIALAALAFIATGTVSAFALPANMQSLGATNPPIGHYDYCKRNPSDCLPNTDGQQPYRLDETNWKTILRINYNVNTTIKPMTDQELYGVEEYWAIPTTAGDCEDYALLKRKLLHEAGVPLSDLLMTVVLQPNGEGHAILTIRTDRGDFVLDNMRNKVLIWSETEYRFLKRQATDNSAKWVKLDDGRVTSTSVGTLR
ncbi:Predicted transglutaminase-like cysteine proteinase [Ensifer adhaerens]|nr:Predicted transglutaminase-like cysteine proteinase [Ensifer adhaerens]HZG28328.1 transglutaminase-like cysteine peptidase [Ensifer sp.]